VTCCHKSDSGCLASLFGLPASYLRKVLGDLPPPPGWLGPWPPEWLQRLDQVPLEARDWGELPEVSHPAVFTTLTEAPYASQFAENQGEFWNSQMVPAWATLPGSMRGGFGF